MVDNDNERIKNLLCDALSLLSPDRIHSNQSNNNISGTPLVSVASPQFFRSPPPPNQSVASPQSFRSPPPPNQSVASPQPPHQSVTSPQSFISPQSSSHSSLSNSMNNFQRCFPSARGRPNPRGRRRGGRPMPYYVPPTTWTHDFFLLPTKSSYFTPERNDYVVLSANGLGKKKVVMQKNGGHSHVRDILEKSFVKLMSQNGAFQLMRCLSGGSGVRQLTPILPEREGYNVQFLKNISKSSVIYIRPLQMDIHVDKTKHEKMVDYSDDINSNVLQTAMTTCQKCSEDVELATFESHLDMCSTPSSSSQANERSIIDMLRDIFPNETNENLASAANNSLDIQGAVDYLISEIDAQSFTNRKIENFKSTNENVKFNDINDILTKYKTDHLAPGECKLKIDREEIWRCALTFYKKSIHDPDPSNLFKSIDVQFTDKSGEADSMDVGAITVEYFTELISIITSRLFEGEPNSLIPKRSGSNLFLYKIFGVIIGHSMLQGGPCCSCLAPWVYEIMCGNTDENCIMSQLEQTPIPLNAATSSTVEFINKLNLISNQKELDDLLEVPEYMQIINSSQWDPTHNITVDVCGSLVSEIVFDELVRKRKEQIKFMREGLYFMKFFFMSKEQEICRLCFVHNETPLTSSIFMGLLECGADFECDGVAQQLAKDFFLYYIDNGSFNRLTQLLKFVTSFSEIPAWGINRKIVIRFLLDDDTKIYPEAMACFHILSLPTVHSTQKVFDMYMDKALEIESTGFSSGS